MYNRTMNTKEILKKTEYEIRKGSLDREAKGIAFDNRKVKEGDVFVCIKGVLFDTHSVVREIAEKDPSVIVVSRDWADEHKDVVDSLPCDVVSVEDTRAAKAAVSCVWYGDPSSELTVIGVTGSKGKTTTSHMIMSMIEKAGRSVGMVGTTGGHINGKEYHFGTTTPDSDKMQEILRMMVDEGCEYAVVEASSQGLKMHRTDQIDFDYGVFLNIDKGDHVSPTEHESFEDYLYCKSLLMKMSKTCVINQDDAHFEYMKNAAGPGKKVYGYGENGDPDYKVSGVYERIVCGKPCVGFDIARKDGGFRDDILIGLPGTFNVVNAAAAVAMADLLGLDMGKVKQSLTKIRVIGRLDMIYRTPDLSVCIDYAHNGLSTRNLLKALRSYEPKRIVLVFGCGGDRDLDRRPEMGRAAGELADFSIITSEHNRFEEFSDILKGIKLGIDQTGGDYIVIEDRKEAIRKAILDSEKGDLVAVIGIGNDGCQHDHGKNIPHDDIEFSRQMIREWEKKTGKENE